MVTALMLMFTLFALGQFSVSYCRTLLQVYEKIELSDQVGEVGEITTEAPCACDFGHLMQLVRAAPDPGDDSSEILAISVYYHAASLIRWLAAPVSGRISCWAQSELCRCAYFAAVSLDRRLAHPAH
ncbi:MAG TPA: hypothetical protein VEG64_02465 [Candidatus Sulfotelmatobacter sp.]|nr:hypothetical protein [Candidatus Sulfotelmatobacter sp.]